MQKFKSWFIVVGLAIMFALLIIWWQEFLQINGI